MHSRYKSATSVCPGLEIVTDIHLKCSICSVGYYCSCQGMLEIGRLAFQMLTMEIRVRVRGVKSANLRFIYDAVWTTAAIVYR